DALVSAGGAEIDEQGLEALRIRSGVPRWGAEIDPDTIPATLGQWIINASVSFTKGCYTGQELVARIESRGGNVPRVLHGLMVEGRAPAAGGAVVGADGVAIGDVTSSAGHGNGSVGLLFVGRSVEVPESGLSVTVGDLPARVLAVPF